MPDFVVKHKNNFFFCNFQQDKNHPFDKKTDDLLEPEPARFKRFKPI